MTGEGYSKYLFDSKNYLFEGKNYFVKLIGVELVPLLDNKFNDELCSIRRMVPPNLWGGILSREFLRQQPLMSTYYLFQHHIGLVDGDSSKHILMGTLLLNQFDLYNDISIFGPICPSICHQIMKCEKLDLELRKSIVENILKTIIHYIVYGFCPDPYSEIHIYFGMPKLAENSNTRDVFFKIGMNEVRTTHSDFSLFQYVRGISSIRYCMNPLETSNLSDLIKKIAEIHYERWNITYNRTDLGRLSKNTSNCLPDSYIRTERALEDLLTLFYPSI